MNRLLIALLIALFALAGSACSVSFDAGDGDSQESSENAEGTTTDEDADATPDEEAIPVETATIRRGSIESVLRSSADLEAESAVGIYSQTAGLVEQLLVEEGDVVRQGQVLIQLEDDEQHSALRKAKAELKKQEREIERQKKLFKDKLISEQDYNDGLHDLEQREIAVEDAQRRLDYTTVRAPISGTITNRMINQGDRVTENAQLFNMVDFESLVARVYLPEKNLGELAVGLPAELSAKALDGRAYRGKVKRIAPVVDGQSGTIKVTVAVGAQPGLRPGMFVDVHLVTAQRDDAVLVPKRALVYDREMTYLFRLDEEGRARRLLIQPELAQKDVVQPKEGVDAGDVIVVAGQAGLKDGSLVDVLKQDGVAVVKKEEPEDENEAGERLAEDEPRDDSDGDAADSGETTATARASR